VRELRVLFALLINAVPVYGVLVEGWSAATILVLYWIENLLTAVATCLRIAVHRSWTRKRGHYHGGQLGVTVGGKSARPIRTFLGEFAAAAMIFTLAHGVFVVALPLILASNHPGDPRWQVSLSQLRVGVAAIASFLGLGLVADLPSLPTWSFARIRVCAQARLGRVLILHLTIIFGMFAIAFTESPYGFLYVLVGLKTLVDVGGALARDEPLPDKPPAWASRIASRVGKAPGQAKADFETEWRREIESSKRQAEEDEQAV
jgi:uncharacterized protein DUF6498